MLPEEVRDRIDFEFEEIESLFELYKKEIFEMAQNPNLFEMTALAGILHSFYNGMEKILLIIAHGVDKKIPTDTKWHKSLLIQMTQANESRSAVLSGETKDRLLDYLGFRAFFQTRLFLSPGMGGNGRPGKVKS